MFYLCSIGSNIEPDSHVSLAVHELLDRFHRLKLSSVIRTRPVGMQSRHDFLNCLFVIESDTDLARLKSEFVMMEIAHGRDRSDPLCKVRDRPLDIDILAAHPDGNFSAATVDGYLGELLAELHGSGCVHDPKVVLSPARPLKETAVWQDQIGLCPVELCQASNAGQGAASVHLDAGACHVGVFYQ